MDKARAAFLEDRHDAKAEPHEMSNATADIHTLGSATRLMLSGMALLPVDDITIACH
jgi:hypothetical protein